MIPLIIFKHQQFNPVPEPECYSSQYRQDIYKKPASMTLPFYTQPGEVKEQGDTPGVVKI
jgi:hypothetical protein